MVAAQADRRQVHHTQLAVEHFVISQAIELLGMRILEWVGSVHAIDLGRLEHHIGIDFDGAQAGSRISGKERITSASSENHHLTGFQMTHGLASVVMIGHPDHGNGRHDDGRNVRALQGVAHGQGIHYRGQHAHVVAGYPVHARSAQGRTTEQVATPNHQTNLHADTDQLADFQRHAVKHLGIDAEIFRPHQGLAAKFEQNALVTRLTTTHLLSHCESLLRRLNSVRV